MLENRERAKQIALEKRLSREAQRQSAAAAAATGDARGGGSEARISVQQMRHMLTARGVDHSNAIERGDLEDMLRRSASQ